MILQELYLQNFCLFRGLHKFLLAPTVRNGASCPITLFGGMNGAGKTTILDAVQLALYGSRARSVSRLGKPFDEYLRECIHRGIEPGEETSVSIKFLYHAEGQQHSYEVWRGWMLKDTAIRERVRVTKDDVPDTFLSEHWNDVVEELIPIGVSQLFFFDAEKIRFLADDEADTAALGTAIKSLLGLDLAERLISDAAIVEKRLSDDILNDAKDDQVVRLEQELEAKSAELTTAKGERAALQNPLLRAQSALEKANAAFSARGGEHWNKRSEIQSQLKATDARIQDVETDLRQLSAGDLPLLLIPELLVATKQQDSVEVEAANAATFVQTLSERDRKILAEARTAKLASEAIQKLRSILEKDRRQRAECITVPRPLDLSNHARSSLSRLVTSGLDELHETAKRLLSKMKSLQTTRDKCIRILDATPDDDAIASVLEKTRTCAAALGTLEGEARHLDERIEALRRERDDLDRAFSSLKTELLTRHIEREDSLRMATLAQRTQSTMREFLRRATAHKIERLSDLVTRSFLFLLHKQTLIARVQIHPDTFRIDLFDDTGKPVPKGRLSEGEKQIFAVALLWGLAQASPRQLPAIIDTPMARLDSEHRKYLVERYFPNASHQVIILSTDTEIEREYFELLRPRVTRSYRLSYDDNRRCTTAIEGYFWDPENVAVRTEAST